MSKKKLDEPQYMISRSVVDKMKPTAKKKGQKANRDIPNEWSTLPGQTYRLLVGPKITDIDPTISPFKTEEPVKIEQKQVEGEQKRKKLMDNLTPSRLKTPYKPLDVTVEQLDALVLPDDLLFHPKFSTQSIDMLSLTKKKSMSRIKRPDQQIVKPPELNEDLTTMIRRQSMSMTSKRARISGVRDVLGDLKSRVCPLDSTSNDKGGEMCNEGKGDELSEGVLGKQESVPMTKEQLIALKLEKAQRKRIRTFFYILRCWASYNVNGASKIQFVLEALQYRVKIHFFRTWRMNVSHILKLQRMHDTCIDKRRRRVTFDTFMKWKEKSSDALRLINMAIDFRNKLDISLSKRFFELLKNVTFCRRICRKDIDRNFRYSPNAQMKPLIPYYDRKRALLLRAYNFQFKHLCPRFIHLWKSIITEGRVEQDRTEQVRLVLTRVNFHCWLHNYYQAVHDKCMQELRTFCKKRISRIREDERKETNEIRTKMIAELRHERSVFSNKLAQASRLAVHREEGLLRRQNARMEIRKTTDEFFIKQEEEFLSGIHQRASDVARQVRSIRQELAKSFLHYMTRAARAYERRNISCYVCIAFRKFSQPIVSKAIEYLCEKRKLANLIRTACLIKRDIKHIINCSKIFHKLFGWEKWRKFIEIQNTKRSKGIMEEIRRRSDLLLLYPYFDMKETLQMRQPKSINEIKEEFADLPEAALAHKIERERAYTLTVKQTLNSRRLLRDFFRAWASGTQVMIAKRTVVSLIRIRRTERLKFLSIKAFRISARKDEVEFTTGTRITNDIDAWLKHFFRCSQEQCRLVEELPYS